jgi:hypothetical protein
MKLDNWQKDLLEQEGNVLLMCGRQVGKSTIMAIDVVERALKKKKTILIISAVERQAQALFDKCMAYLNENYPKEIRKGKDKPTRSTVNLKNGSEILSLPTGLDGHGIRFLTIDELYADEAAFIPEAVWVAVTPMLAVRNGKQHLFSTPHGNSGYFIECSKRNDFLQVRLSTEEVFRNREICNTWTNEQLESALNFIEQEKKRLTKLQFAQEYLGYPVNELKQVFDDELIKKCMQLKRRGTIMYNRDYYLGVDIARMGDDDTTFEIIDRTNRENLEHVENLITKRTLLTDTFNRIIELNRIYKFKQIFIDDGGLGVGVFDMLLTHPETSRKVIAINNSYRPLTKDEKQKKRTLKEDIYNNLLMLMERDAIKLLDDAEIFQSLKSVQFEIDEKSKIKYFGNYTHIVDGLVRAAWCAKDKSLNIWVTSLKI